MDRLNWTDKRLSRRVQVFMVSAIVMSLANWFSEGMLRNNGDYWRVSRLFGLSFPTGDVSSTSWRFDNGPTHHAATLFAVFGRVVDTALQPLHLQSFNMWWLYAALSLTYFLGTYLAANGLRTSSDTVIAYLFFLIFIAYGFIAKSFYEESLLLILSPWLYWSIRFFHRTKRVLPVLVVGALLVATKQQSMALIPTILCLTFLQARLSRKVVFQFIAVVAALAVTALTLNVRIGVFRYTDANRYDRLMNGVGAAMGGIAFQPGTTSDQWRSAMTDSQGLASPSVAGSESCAAIPQDVRKYLGSANWPLGVEIQNSDAKEYEKIIHAGRWGSFLKITATCPILSTKLLVNMSVGTARADYQLDYIRTQQSHQAILQPFLWLRNGILRIWGWLMLATAVIALYRMKGWRDRLIATFCFLMFPFGVIAGDGFYEFEKHTLVFIGFFPLVYLFLRLRGGTEAVNNA